MNDFKNLAVYLAQEAHLGLDAQDKVRKGIPHRIRFRGKFIRTHSKKTVWPSKGAAANALNLELHTVFYNLLTEDYSYRGGYRFKIKSSGQAIGPLDYSEKEDFFLQFVQEMKKEIEIVPVSADEFYQRAAK